MRSTNKITTEWSGTPLKKLDALLTDGWQVSGVSIVKTMPDGTVRRGAITTGGMVLWWPTNCQTIDEKLREEYRVGFDGPPAD